MKNYEDKLLSLEPAPAVFQPEKLPLAQIVAASTYQNIAEFEKAQRKLAKSLPFKSSSWPKFGAYTEDWFRVEIGPYRIEIQYCERGSCDVRNSCKNFLDATYEILKIIAPNYSSEAQVHVEALDRIKDQRVLIWLRQASEIKHMFEANAAYGLRSAHSVMLWMSEELIRMGVYSEKAQAIKSHTHIVHAMRLAGIPEEHAKNTHYQAVGA